MRLRFREFLRFIVNEIRFLIEVAHEILNYKENELSD